MNIESIYDGENTIQNPNRIIPNEKGNKKKAPKRATKLSKDEKILQTVAQIEGQVQVNMNINQKKLIDNGYLYTYCLQKTPGTKENSYFLQQKIVSSAEFHSVLPAPLKEEQIAMASNIYPQYEKIQKSVQLAMKRVITINSSIWASLETFDKFKAFATVDNIVHNPILNRDLIEVNIREEVQETNLKNSTEEERSDYAFLILEVRKVLTQRVRNICSELNTERSKSYSKIIEEGKINIFEKVFEKVTQTRKEKSVDFVRFIFGSSLDKTIRVKVDELITDSHKCLPKQNLQRSNHLIAIIRYCMKEGRQPEREKLFPRDNGLSDEEYLTKIKQLYIKLVPPYEDLTCFNNYQVQYLKEEFHTGMDRVVNEIVRAYTSVQTFNAPPPQKSLSNLIDSLFDTKTASIIYAKVNNGANWLNTRRDILKIAEDTRKKGKTQNEYKNSSFFNWFYSTDWRQTPGQGKEKGNTPALNNTMFLVLGEQYGIYDIESYSYSLSETSFGLEKPKDYDAKFSSFASKIESFALSNTSSVQKNVNHFKMITRESSEAFRTLYQKKKRDKIEKLLSRNDRGAFPLTGDTLALIRHLNEKEDRILIEIIKQLVIRVKSSRDQEMIHDMIVAGKQRYDSVKDKEQTIFNLKNIKMDRDINLHSAEAEEAEDFNAVFETNWKLT